MRLLKVRFLSSIDRPPFFIHSRKFSNGKELCELPVNSIEFRVRLIPVNTVRPDTTRRIGREYVAYELLISRLSIGLLTLNDKLDLALVASSGSRGTCVNNNVCSNWLARSVSNLAAAMVNRDLATNAVGWIPILVYQNRDEPLPDGFFRCRGQERSIGEADVLPILVEDGKYIILTLPCHSRTHFFPPAASPDRNSTTSPSCMT